MKECEGHFHTRDGQEFYERRWLPDAAPRANLVFIHGFGEHCNRYGEVGKGFTDAGVAIHTFDQRGFGKSPGRRAYIQHFDQLLDDMDDYLAAIHDRLTGAPVFVMGHSMGGMVLTRYAETRNIPAKGLIFTSSFLGFIGVSPFLLTLSGILGSIMPWLPVGGVDNSWLSRDPAIITAADQDPLAFHGKVRARTGAQFNQTIKRAQAEMGRITLPACIIHGTDDHVVPPSGSQILFDRISSKDKTLKWFEGGYHELWNDLVKKEWLAYVLEWIFTRV